MATIMKSKNDAQGAMPLAFCEPAIYELCGHSSDEILACVEDLDPWHFSRIAALEECTDTAPSPVPQSVRTDA